jgi:hypothetical protein
MVQGMNSGVGVGKEVEVGAGEVEGVQLVKSKKQKTKIT